MPHFFVSPENIKGNRVLIEGGEALLFLERREETK